MPEHQDLKRLRNEYAGREHRFADKHFYSAFNQANLFAIQQRERSIWSVLSRHGFQNLKERKVLEVGCGDGGVLINFLVNGADPLKIHGIDLLYSRLKHAKKKLALSWMVNADGQSLPYSSETFDLVLQFTAFSSILDDQIKSNMAADMLRVLKPEGAVLWYDFWLNPTNPQTRGIRPKEIRKLFPDCSYDLRKITLAPPIARRVVPISWGLALFLESLTIFNSHYLVLIRNA
jgi:ubiquinone/menaquinone biosynthesis C-methylase UbiE